MTKRGSSGVSTTTNCPFPATGVGRCGPWAPPVSQPVPASAVSQRACPGDLGPASGPVPQLLRQPGGPAGEQSHPGSLAKPGQSLRGALRRRQPHSHNPAQGHSCLGTKAEPRACPDARHGLATVQSLKPPGRVVNLESCGTVVNLRLCHRNSAASPLDTWRAVYD